MIPEQKQFKFFELMNITAQIKEIIIECKYRKTTNKLKHLD